MNLEQLYRPLIGSRIELPYETKHRCQYRHIERKSYQDHEWMTRGGSDSNPMLVPFFVGIFKQRMDFLLCALDIFPGRCSGTQLIAIKMETSSCFREF